MTTDQLTSPTTATPTRDRLLGLSGLGYVAALVVVVAVPHAGIDNAYDDPPASAYLTRFFRAHDGLEQYQALMHSVAGVLLVVFGIALAAQVRRVAGAETASRLVAAGAVGAGTVMVTTMLLVSGSVTLTGGVAGRTQWWLYNLGWEEHFKALYLWPLLLVPACLVLRRARALPRALTWTGLLVAVLCGAAMVGGLTAGTEFLQFPVFFLTMLWTLATSVVALVRGVGPRLSAG